MWVLRVEIRITLPCTCKRKRKSTHALCHHHTTTNLWLFIAYIHATTSTSDSVTYNVIKPVGGGGSSRERLRLRSLHWDPYEPGSQSYMDLGTKPKIRSHYRSHKMALWLNLIPQIHLPGGSDVSLAHHAFQDDNPNLYVGKCKKAEERKGSRLLNNKYICHIWLCSFPFIIHTPPP